MYIKFSTIWSLVSFFILLSCENEKPNLAWDPNPNIKPQPVIQSIEPAQGAFAGVQKIHLKGQNFSPITEENFLTVNGKQGTIISAGTSELTVIPPLVIGDSLTIRLDVRGSYYAAEYKPYTLLSPANPFGNIKEDEAIQDFEFDKDGNLYALVTNSAGERIVYKQTAGDTTRVEYGRVTVPIGTPSMKFGPDGSLYICRKNNKKFYRIPPGGGSTEQYLRLSGKVQSFDFDADGNIYIGGSGNEIYRIMSDKSVKTVANYDTIDIVCLRIYENFVYVIGQYEQQTPEGLNVYQKIWRNKIILSNDTLASKELVFDWSEYNNSDLLSAFTFSAEGEIFVSSNSKDPIAVISPDRSASIYLQDILPSPAIGLAWDEEEFFYYIHQDQATSKRNLIRVYTGKQGAVYNGRK